MSDKIERAVNSCAGRNRAEKVTAAIRMFHSAATEASIAVCELAYEAQIQKHYLKIRDAKGRPYTSIFRYLSDILEINKKSTIWRRLRVGRSLHTSLVTDRRWLRAEMTSIGVRKSEVICSAIRSASSVEQASKWFEAARKTPVRALENLVKANGVQRINSVAGPGRPELETVCCPHCSGTGRIPKRQRRAA